MVMNVKLLKKKLTKIIGKLEWKTFIIVNLIHQRYCFSVNVIVKKLLFKCDLCDSSILCEHGYAQKYYNVMCVENYLNPA